MEKTPTRAFPAQAVMGWGQYKKYKGRKNKIKDRIIW